MMTPKEVQEHGFPRSRKGYDMAEVDDFLDKLTEDYTALYNNYGKLSSSYAKLRKKAQALASALEQVQQQGKTTAAAAPAPKPEPVQPTPQQTQQSAVVASQAAVDDILRTARKDAEAIRAGAERERQEIIAEATDYAAENAERLKNEVAAEEQKLANLKKSTADYISQMRQLISRQSALLDSTPVQAGTSSCNSASGSSTASPKEEEPTVRVDNSDAAEASMAEEISRNMMNLHFDDDDDENTKVASPRKSSDPEDTGSLFDTISSSGEFDEE